MSILNLTEKDFDREVMESDKPVLVDFFATWCGPCNMLHPIIEEIAEEHPEYKICQVDVDREPDLAMRFGVMSIPSLIAVKNGEIVETSLGFCSKDEVLEMLS